MYGFPENRKVELRSKIFNFAAMGLRRDFRAKVLSLPLKAACKAWQLGVYLDRLLTRPVKLPRPVVSVGNITLGGTGKTPFVVALGRELLKRKVKVAVLTRGYKASGRDRDEPCLLREALPGAQVLVSPNRARAALESLNRDPAPEIFILDDGFQHWKLCRDLDIVLLDCILPFGLGALVPFGFLREPIHSISRADFVVLTRSRFAAPWKVQAIKEYLRVRFPSVKVLQVEEKIRGFLSPDRAKVDPPQEPVYGVCGIGNPASFFKLLDQEGIQWVGGVAFPDHFPWDREAVEFVEKKALQAGARSVVTTGKDFTKIRFMKTSLPWRVVDMYMEFGAGAEELLTSVEALLQEDRRSFGSAR